MWTALDQTTNSCDEFDYFPRGGARIFACHMFSLVSYERIVAVAGRAPFRAGPHGSGLNLHATNDFGHYDPEFVRFVAQHAVPARHDSAFRAATQAHYDAYVGPLARIFYATHQKLVNNPACFAAERDEYAAAIARGDTQDYVEPWFFFMNPTSADVSAGSSIAPTDARLSSWVRIRCSLVSCPMRNRMGSEASSSVLRTR